MDELMKRELSWHSMQSMYVDLYSKTFSQQDVDDMMAFNRSPAA